ncbi:MAG: prephenate dehydratase [Desulfovibrio sp.]|jgi:chorismate mutase/prephenate dehydratase|nr:prephenate dehydratase [Desulfovibrio sp.]
MAANPEHSLEELRAAISEVDRSLVALLNKRATLSLDVGSLKRGSAASPIFRPGREAELLKTLATCSAGPLPESHLRAIYREILSSSRYLQSPQRVAFLGPEGTFSHMAGRALLGSLASFHPQHNLPMVFQAVESGDCDIGVVPLENSLQGSVGQSFDLFMKHPLHIRTETYCRIRHSLLSRERDLASVNVVYSHPQPLAQCANWLMRNLPRARVAPLESTAAAAHHVAEEAGAAAIAHADLAAELGLHLLANGMEDQPGNWTRFAVVGRNPADRPGADKTSLLFSVADKPGSLFRVLQCLADKSINMRKLESRPQGDNWKYIFFADLECDIFNKEYAGILESLEEHCLSLRVLGSYPSGRQE